MRTLRIARPARLALAGGWAAPHREVWAGLPEAVVRFVGQPLFAVVQH